MIPDSDLIKKYSVSGPRYTSYPTAPHFRSDLPEAEVSAAMDRELKRADRNLSLYTHIPFCDTLCYFCGCTTIVTRNPEKPVSYLEVLDKEVELYSSRIEPGRKVEQMHFGGGTPTHLSPAQLDHLGETLHSHFRFSDDAEIGCEIDPRELTEAHVKALRNLGTNRVSLGVQDFNEKVQKAVNRIQSEELITEVSAWIRNAGITSLNMDLIYGLPHQNQETFLVTLEKVMAFRPDRLAVFNYAHVPWIKPHQKLIHAEDLPSPEEKIAMLQMMTRFLEENGYVYIGMDHFARKDDELTLAQKNGTLQRNFQGYSTRAGLDIVAFGMSGISQYDNLYIQNHKDLDVYGRMVDEGKFPIEKAYIMTDEDMVRRSVISDLMCNLKLDLDVFGKQHGIDAPAHFSDALNRLDSFYDEGLAERTGNVLTITDKGRFFIRNIAMLFDAYLPTDDSKYSKTV